MKRDATFEVTLTRDFAAPRERVFAAWTEPGQLAQWWGPKGFSNPVCEWNAEPGGKIYVVMRGPNGQDYPMNGTVREVVAPERLVITTGALDEQGQLLFELEQTVTFAEHHGQTRLTIHARAIMVTDRAEQMGGYNAGMSQSLERLAETLAGHGGPLVLERTFPAPVALVWQAITHPADLKEWYFDIPDFRAEPGCKFQFLVEHEGFKYFHQCTVTAVIPERKLAYTWRYDGHAGDSEVTIELFPEGERTRLRLTHEGLNSFPRLPSFARKNFFNGWTSLVGTCLREHLEKLQHAATADRAIVISRVFDAPRELVWEAWTQPEYVAQWWGPRGFTMTIETMDVRPGGVWKQVMHGPDGTDYPNCSVFTEVVKPERIVFAQSGSKAGAAVVEFISTWTFEAPAPGQTRLTIRMVFPTVAARDVVVREYGAIEGGQQTLARLGELLAEKWPAGSGRP